MIRRTQKAFRTNGPRLNLQDDIFANAPQPLFGQYTQGATLIDRADVFPPYSDKLQITEFAVSARLAIGVNRSGNHAPIFGRLGPVVVGITTEADPTTGVGAVGYSETLLPLPADLALSGTLWAPTTDALPPQFDYVAGGNTTPIAGGFNPIGLQAGATVTLPTPFPVPRGGGSLRIGIWKFPSIVSADDLGNIGITFCVLDATWAMTYDDGTE